MALRVARAVPVMAGPVGAVDRGDRDVVDIGYVLVRATAVRSANAPGADALWPRWLLFRENAVPAHRAMTPNKMLPGWWPLPAGQRFFPR